MATYKNEVFKLAKKLGESSFSEELVVMRKLISSDAVEERLNPKQIFFSSAREGSTHFYGVLLVNSEIENGSVKELMFKKLETFTGTEKSLYFQGNQILNDVFNSLISQLDFLPFSYRLALSPYAGLRTIDLGYVISVDRIFATSEYDRLSCAFGNMSLTEDVKRKFFEIDSKFKNIKFEDVLILLEKIKKEIYKYGFQDYPSEMGKISLERMHRKFNDNEKNLDFFYSLYCLKESIATTFNTLFSGLIGKNMGIINEDNIINISDDFSNPVKRGKTFLLISDNPKTEPDIGNITLMTYNQRISNEKIHDFGIAYSITHSFLNEEFGETIKVSMLLIDECLNMYYPFIERRT